jgi:hypothetical protein
MLERGHMLAYPRGTYREAGPIAIELGRGQRGCWQMRMTLGASGQI